MHVSNEIYIILLECFKIKQTEYIIFNKNYVNSKTKTNNEYRNNIKQENGIYLKKKYIHIQTINKYVLQSVQETPTSGSQIKTVHLN